MLKKVLTCYKMLIMIQEKSTKQRKEEIDLGKIGLRQYRLMREISKQEMAKRLGVHPNTYSAWEDKPDSISIGKAFEICKILGVSFESIFLGENSTKC